MSKATWKTRGWQPEHEVLLQRLYPVTETWEALLTAFPFSTKRGIQAKAAALGLRKPKIRHCWRRHDETLFQTWTERSAYILGYLEADGTFVVGPRSLRVAFNASRSDRDYLVQLREWVGSDAKISDVTMTRKDGTVDEASTFSVSSRSWKTDLAGKYRLDRIPECLPDESLRHYVRGYFDGDGSVYWSRQVRAYRSSLVFGSEELAHSFEERLRPLFGRSHRIHRKVNSKRCWYFQMANEATQQLVSFIYRDAYFYLRRKFVLAQAVLGGG